MLAKWGVLLHVIGDLFFFYVESWLFKHNKKPIEIVRYDKIVVFMRRKADLNVTKSIYLKIIMVLFLKDRKKNIRKRNIGLYSTTNCTW